MGLRISDVSILEKLYKDSLDYRLLIDKSSDEEARAILVKYLGNAQMQGSIDGISYHYLVTSEDKFFRFSADGGSSWIYTDLNSIDKYYFNNGDVYGSTAEAIAAIPFAVRTPYMTVNISGVEYWFVPPLSDIDLVPKTQEMSIIDGSVVLGKLVDIADDSVIGNNSGSVGSPRVISSDDLKTMLDLQNTNTGDESKLTIETKLGLGAGLHFVQSDELDNYTPSAEGYSLISDTELTRLSLLYKNVYTIEFPIGNIVDKTASPTLIPDEWSAYPVAGVNLGITHNLVGRRLASVNIYEIDGSTERLLVPFDSAYSGVITNGQSIEIEGFAPTLLASRIELIFN